MDQLTEILNSQGFTDSTIGIDWTADMSHFAFEGSYPFVEFLVKTMDLHLRRKLDYIWSKGFHTASAVRVDMEDSDHQPIVAKLIGS